MLGQAKDQLVGKMNAAGQALTGSAQSAQEKVQELLENVGPVSQEPKEEKRLALETAEQAEAHRKARGEEDPISPRRSALGRHYDIGGVADFGPVDTERMEVPRSG